MTIDWRHLASCLGTPGSLWDTPPHKPGSDRDQLVLTARKAFAICARCPVQSDCRADAEEHHTAGVIQAGIAYDSAGIPSRACGHCGHQIVARNGALAKYCSSACSNLAEYQKARTERLAA